MNWRRGLQTLFSYSLLMLIAVLYFSILVDRSDCIFRVRKCI
jgi:Mg2+/citrate symporter